MPSQVQVFQVPRFHHLSSTPGHFFRASKLSAICIEPLADVAPRRSEERLGKTTWTSKPWYPVPKINRTRSRRLYWDVHHFQIVCLQSTNRNKPVVGLIGWTVFRAHSHFVGSRDFQGWHCGEIMMYSMNTCWAWKVPHHTSPHRSLPCYTTVSCISHVL